MTKNPRVQGQVVAAGLRTGTPAADEFARCVARYGEDLLDEVERVEAAGRVSPAVSAEFTSSMVTDADRWLRRGYSGQRKLSPWRVASRVVLSLLLVALGVVASELFKPWAVIVLIVLLVITIAGLILEEVWGRLQ